MAKKKKAKAKKKATPKKKKLTCIQFLRDLYEGNPNIANDKALLKLLAKFPMSKAGLKALTTWKNMLRKEGIDIPMRQAKKVTKKVAKKKKKSKKKRK